MRGRRLALACGSTLLATTVLLAGCSGDDEPGGSADPDVPGAGTAATTEGPCPAALPTTSEGGGFGTQEPAASAPSLTLAGSATVCRYDTDEGDEAAGDAGGTTYEWLLSGPPVEVPERDLETLGRLAGDLEPAPARGGCTDDLGPRWLLVSTDGDAVAGVVVDDFGCRQVRLTDDPAATPPGEVEDGAGALVGGVLGGPAALLQRIKLVWIQG